MPDIFDSLDINEEKPSQDIFDTISYKEPSRARSLVSAPVKGVLKGLNEIADLGEMVLNPVGTFFEKKRPAEYRERIFEKSLPTQKKETEKLLERGGRLSTYLIGPGKIAGKLVRGGLATLAGQFAEDSGFGKGPQALLEAAAFLSPTSFKGAQKYVSSLYSQANNLARGAHTPAVRLRGQTQAFLRDLSRGGPATSKNAAKSQAEGILKKIKRNTIDVNELTEFKKTINEARSGLYAERSLDKTGRKTAKRYLDQVSKIVDSALEQYGNRNPSWHKVYKDANEGFGAIQNSKKASNFIGRVIKQHPHASGTVLAGALFGHILSPGLIAQTAAGYAGLKGAELISRIIKSKVLRKYYSDALKATIKENPASFLINMKKLEDSLNSEKEKES